MTDHKLALIETVKASWLAIPPIPNPPAFGPLDAYNEAIIQYMGGLEMLKWMSFQISDWLREELESRDD